MEAAFALAAGELCLERVEALAPERPEVAEPVIELAERRGVDGVEPAGANGSNVREPGCEIPNSA